MSISHEDTKIHRASSKNRVLLFICIASFSIGILIISLIYYPVLKQELMYLFRSETLKTAVPVADPATHKQNTNQSYITPVNNTFSVVIPKIGANAPVISDVDPFNESEYQLALSRGVAHAFGTRYPGDIGNMFLFAHSATDVQVASRYNAVFYLLSKLEKNDPIYIFYNGDRYTYRVTESAIVDSADIEYLSGESGSTSGTGVSGKKLTLMTCWPAGTTLKRLIIKAEL